MSVEEYKSVLDVHLTGAFALTKAVVPYMKEKRHGRIIFQASMTSYIGQPMVAGYASAKAGYLGLIHTLTAELAEYGITANAIAPGSIPLCSIRQPTVIHRDLEKSWDAFRQKWSETRWISEW